MSFYTHYTLKVWLCGGLLSAACSRLVFQTSGHALNEWRTTWTKVGMVYHGKWRSKGIRFDCATDHTLNRQLVYRHPDQFVSANMMTITSYKILTSWNFTYTYRLLLFYRALGGLKLVSGSNVANCLKFKIPAFDNTVCIICHNRFIVILLPNTLFQCSKLLRILIILSNNI